MDQRTIIRRHPYLFSPFMSSVSLGIFKVMTIFPPSTFLKTFYGVELLEPLLSYPIVDIIA